MSRARLTVAGSLLIAVVLAACTDTPAEPDEPVPGRSQTTTAPTGKPDLELQIVADGLEHPWDIVFLPGGDMAFTERDRERVTIMSPDGKRRTVLESPDGMWHSGETGLMSIELAEDFESTREFMLCHGFQSGATQDVRITRWRLDEDLKEAAFVRNLVTGLPSSSGRHGGCAMTTGDDSALYIGTGDAAIGTNAQDLRSGGGKILRVDPQTGEGLDDNPFAGDGNTMKRRVWSFGHRNVQGLTLDADNRLWGLEHGPTIDDEVNLIEKGGNYGWNPVPGYNESVPMTDQDLPGKQIEASWQSGDSTIAVSAGTFLLDDRWRDYQGALAMASLKDETLRMLIPRDGTTLAEIDNLAEFDGTFGRLRGAVEGPDGSLYVTTSNGNDDKIVKVTAS